MRRFTFPESDESGVVIDAFDRGSQIGMLDARTIVGYTTRNSGGVPDNFRNYFVVRFDTPFSAVELTDAPGEYEPGSSLLYPDGSKSVTADTPWRRCTSRPAAASRSAPAWLRRSSRPNRPFRISGSWGPTTSRPSSPRRRSAGTKCWAASRSRAAPKSRCAPSIRACTVRCFSRVNSMK